MNPTILNFPTLSANPSKADWKLNRFDARNVSPLSGTFQDIQRPGTFWSCDLSWQVLSYADSQLLLAWSAQMSRGGFRTMLPNYAYTMQGVGTGTPIVDGASQTGTSLTTSGWTHSVNGILQAGDMVQIYGGTLTFTAAPANGAAISFKDFYGNSYSVGTGNGTATTFNLPNTFFTGYGIYVAGTLQSSGYTTTMQHQLLVLTQNANSNSSGVATLNFEPAMRFRPPNSNSIVIANPQAAFAFAKPDASISYTAPRIGSISLALVEDIQL